VKKSNEWKAEKRTSLLQFIGVPAFKENHQATIFSFFEKNLQPYQYFAEIYTIISHNYIQIKNVKPPLFLFR